MSALTEKVAREHPPLTVGRPPDIGIGCRHCSHAASYAEHVAEVTEAATRAAVAAEIRALEPTREQPPQIGTVSEKRAEFDRWLAGVKAESWGEGYEWVDLCVCGTEGLTWSTHAAHVAEVTEAATRAAVAADIRAEADAFMRVTLATYDDPPVKAYLDAARIAEGKQP